MPTDMATEARNRSRSWLTQWRPEEPAFWESEGKKRAWLTLWITTANLIMAFIIWFLVSALVVRLPNIGFQLDTDQLFWLTAMPGLAGGTFRLIHNLLTPIFGTRSVVTWSTLSLLIPAVGWVLAVQDPTTPFWVLMVLAFLAGLGGGNFSSFMPSTSLFFPKRLQGTALAIQAGIGNLGVSVVQFLTPWIIGLAFFGTLAGAPQVFTKGAVVKDIWLQNAALIYVPFIVVFAIAGWIWLRSVPIRASFKEQFDINKNKHTWLMTSLYLMTFGSFAGFSATFPLLIKQLYGGFEGAPDPLAYAFYGPLVGSVMRTVAGPVADKFGGARVTQISALGLVASALAVAYYSTPETLDEFPFFVTSMLAVFFFTGVGNASTFKQMPMIFPPRQAGGVIGWTGAMAAYGPFAVGLMLGYSISWFGSPNAFFYWAAIFFAICVGINWWYYARKGAEKPC
ncbi:MAG TPA: nitrate/nitrite transporter, partial [Alphaproteobacteria bacterium]|nr:nitrate/nitrite transporter [Alphaproteobacteria bacterium]